MKWLRLTPRQAIVIALIVVVVAAGGTIAIVLAHKSRNEAGQKARENLQQVYHEQAEIAKQVEPMLDQLESLQESGQGNGAEAIALTNQIGDLHPYLIQNWPKGQDLKPIDECREIIRKEMQQGEEQ